MARECPEPKQKTRPYHSCEKVGHLSKDCPAPKKARKKPSPYDMPWDSKEDDRALRDLISSIQLKKKYDKVSKRFIGIGEDLHLRASERPDINSLPLKRSVIG